MLGFGTASTDNRSIVVGEITRPYDRATAVSVMQTKVAGKSKTRPMETVITAAELEGIKENIKAGKGYEGLPELSGPDALNRVTALDAYLAPPKIAPTGDGTIPHFLIDVLWSEPHKEAARLIADRFGRIPAKASILDNGATATVIGGISITTALVAASTPTSLASGIARTSTPRLPIGSQRKLYHCDRYGLAAPSAATLKRPMCPGRSTSGGNGG